MTELLYAIAVSVLSSPAENALWELAAAYGPGEVYERATYKGREATQDYLKDLYTSQPIESAKRIYEAAGKKGITLVSYWDKGYPDVLRHISMPPLVLYSLGDFTFSHAMAVVGTRRSDSRSSYMAQEVVRCIVQKGYAVVSGMAMGLDRDAHWAALDNGGSTVGVLANGIDIAYPRSNTDLYKRIISTKGSGLVSEYPPGIYTQKWTFVRRNRIISGLSLGTVVIKAAEKSGALITARFALEQNRDVYACTGYSFDAAYAGCHRLIQDGACLIVSQKDFMDEIKTSIGNNIFINENYYVRPPAGVSNDRSEKADTPKDEHAPAHVKAILERLNEGERSVDSLVSDTGFSINKVNETISMLEITGRIVRKGNYISKL